MVYPVSCEQDPSLVLYPSRQTRTLELSRAVTPQPLHSFDEFTRLRAIVVGDPTHANHPRMDATFQNFFQPPNDPKLRKNAVGPIPQIIIDEINQDIANFIAVLHEFGVEVLRPKPWDSTVTIKTQYWETEQLYSLMPRDCLLVVGDLIIESASPTRSRFLESQAFRNIVDHYLKLGAHVISAPRPLLNDETFDTHLSNLITEKEILFDAANCVRLGRDIFIDINRTANHRALHWLERTLRGLVSPDIRVHPMSLGHDHVDVTLIPLRPGVLLVDPDKVTEHTIPSQFRRWERIVVEEVMEQRNYGLPYPLASNDGIGRNVLMLGNDTVIVDDIQLPLIRALEKRHFNVIPLQYRHGRTLGGSWHCITLDTHREGELVSYV